MYLLEGASSSALERHKLFLSRFNNPTVYSLGDSRAGIISRLVGSLVVYVPLLIGAPCARWPDMARNSITAVGVPGSLSILYRVVVALAAVFMSYYRGLLNNFFRLVTSPKELEGAY